MKLSDFLKDKLKAVFKKSEDLETFVAASALRELEIPDDIAGEFDRVYLTRDKAINDEELVKKFQADIKGMVYGSVDQKIKHIMQFLSADAQAEVENEKNTLKKLEIIQREMPNLGKTVGDDVKKIQEAARKKEEELRNLLESATKEKEKTQSDFENKLRDYKLEYQLRTKMAAIELAPEFSDEKRKNFLADSTIAALKGQYILEPDEANPGTIHLRKNYDGLVKDVYEGNKKVTLDDVLAKEFEPFRKKSNGKDGSDHTHQQQASKKIDNSIPSDGPKDLKTMRMQAAGS